MVVETGAGEPFWKMLTPAEQTVLKDAGWISMFARGEVLCRQGDRTTYIIIVLDGWVKISRVSRDGQQLVLALRGQGELVGEMAGQTAEPRSATLLAVAPVEALQVDHDKFMEFLRTHSHAERVYQRGLIERWTETATTMNSRVILSVAQRLAGLLVDLADQYGTSDADGISLDLPLSQEDLAGLVGTTRAPVTRALANWRGRGLIRTGHRRITISNIDGLRKVARR